MRPPRPNVYRDAWAGELDAARVGDRVRVAGWVQNQFTSHRAEKREVMGAFLQALRAEYGQVVGDAAFRHAVGDRTTHSLRGSQVQAARQFAEAPAVDDTAAE